VAERATATPAEARAARLGDWLFLALLAGSAALSLYLLSRLFGNLPPTS